MVSKGEAVLVAGDVTATGTHMRCYLRVCLRWLTEEALIRVSLS